MSQDDLANALRELAASVAGHNNDAIVPPGQRRCPICGQAMESLNQHDVVMDLCEDHGVWLDQGELATLLNRTYWHRRSEESKPVRDRELDRHKTRQAFKAGVNRAASMLAAGG